MTPSAGLSEFIKDLTGIRDSDFNWSRSRRSVYIEFCEFVKSLVDGKTFYEFIVWGQGDVNSLMKEIDFLNATENNIKFPLSHRRSMDVKSIIQCKDIAKGNRASSKISLKTALCREKISSTGKYHDAAVDATNTLALFLSIVTKEV